MSVTIKTLNEGFNKKYLREESELQFFNGMDKDLVEGAVQWEILGKELIKDNNIKCSKSALNNLVYFLRHGKNCKLCLGAFRRPNSDEYLSDRVSHVWVECDGDIYQTHVPALIKSNNSLSTFKCIDFYPADLERLSTKIKSIM